MSSSQAQWIRYGAYSLVVVMVILGAYYFLYVQNHAEQLESDRIAMLRESSAYFTEEVVRLKDNLANTFTERQLRGGDKDLKELLLASKIREIDGVDRTPVNASDTDYWRDACSAELGKTPPPSIYARFEPAAPHPKLHFTFAAEGPCRLATVNPNALLRPLLPQDKTAFDQLLLVRTDGTVLLPGEGESLSMLDLPLRDQAANNNDQRSEGLYTDIFTLNAAGGSYRAFLQPFRLPLPVHYDADTADVVESGHKDQQETLYLTGLKNEAAFQAEARQLPPMVGFGLLGLLGLTLLAFPFLEVWLVSPTEPFKAHDILEVAVGVVIVAAVASFVLLNAFCYEGLTERQSSNLTQLSKTIATTVEQEADAASAQLDELTHNLRTCVNTQRTACIRKTKILDEGIADASRYPHLEMASWINANGHQIMKWSVERQTTPLINVANREYFQAHAAAVESPVSMPERDKVWRKTEGDTTKWVLQSIRSNTTGEVFAQISKPIPPSKRVRHPVRADSAVVASATIPLLSLIEPVLPTGYGFALINDDGEVLFHTDSRRNLRENLFDKVEESAPLREAAQAHRALQLTTRYRGEPHQFYSTPLQESPWTLVVFSNLTPIRVLQGQAMTYGIGLYLGGLLLLLLLVLVPCMAISNRIEFGLTGLFRAVWPDPRKTSLYRHLVQWELGLLGTGLVLLGLIILDVAPVLSLIGLFVLSGAAIGLLCYYCSRPAPAGEGPWPRDWWTNYNWSLVLITIIVGGLVPTGVYCLLHDESARLLVKEHQRVFAHELIERGDHIVEQYRNVPLSDATAHTLESHLFPTEPKKDTERLGENAASPAPTVAFPDTSLGIAGFTQPARPDTANKNLVDRTYRLLFPSDAWEANRHRAHIPWDIHTLRSSQPLITSSPPKPTGDASAQPVHDIISKTAFAPWGKHLYMLSESASGDEAWEWRTRRNGLLFSMELPYRPHSLTPNAGPDLQHATAPNRTLEIRSSVPTVAALFPEGGYEIVGGLVVFLLLIGLWWALHRYLIGQVYFLQAVPTVATEKTQAPATYAPPTKPPRSLFVRSYHGPEDDREDVSHYIDSADMGPDAAPGERAQEAAASGADVVIVDHLHNGLDDPEIAQVKLDLLKALADLDQAVELYSEVDPLSILRTAKENADAEAPTTEETAPDTPSEPAAESPADAPPAPPTDVPLNEWAVALRDYRRHWDLPQEDPETPPVEALHSPVSPNATDRTSQNLECLARECRPDSYLREEIAPFLADTLDLEVLDEEQIIEQVQYQAEAHYQYLWTTCSDQEKVVLYRLSTDGFASPNSFQIVQELLRRGLLVMDPALRPMNESFRTFVATLDSPVIAEYEQQAWNESWRRVQAPLLLGLVAVLAFIFVTQPNLAQEAAAFLPTLAAGLPALLKIVSALFVGQSAMGFTN